MTHDDTKEGGLWFVHYFVRAVPKMSKSIIITDFYVPVVKFVWFVSKKGVASVR